MFGIKKDDGDDDDDDGGGGDEMKMVVLSATPWRTSYQSRRWWTWGLRGCEWQAPREELSSNKLSRILTKCLPQDSSFFNIRRRRKWKLSLTLSCISRLKQNWRVKEFVFYFYNLVGFFHLTLAHTHTFGSRWIIFLYLMKATMTTSMRSSP